MILDPLPPSNDSIRENARVASSGHAIEPANRARLCRTINRNSAGRGKTEGMAEIETPPTPSTALQETNPLTSRKPTAKRIFATTTRGLGAIPYERNHHWLTFFATVADEIVRVFRPASVLDAGRELGLLGRGALGSRRPRRRDRYIELRDRERPPRYARALSRSEP